MSRKHKLSKAHKDYLNKQKEEQERVCKRFEELLEKNKPLEIADIFDFYGGLTRGAKELAGQMFIGHCMLDGKTPREIHQKLQHLEVHDK